MSRHKIKILDNGNLEVNADFFEWFEFNELFTVKALVSWPDKTILKNAAKDRYTMKLRLPGIGGAKKDFIVKYFRPKPLFQRFMEYLDPFHRPSGARHEWNAMWAFLELGLPGPVPVAWGRGSGFSAVVSEAVNYVMKLDQWVEKNHRVRETNEWAPIKRELIKYVAEIVGRMHANGLHHQDLYLCHFLCGSEKYGLPLTLIDLQRVRKHKKLPKRWQVKDLAQLHFSSEEFICKEDIEWFCHNYKKAFGQHTGKASSSLWKAIVRKSNRIKRHTQKHGL